MRKLAIAMIAAAGIAATPALAQDQQTEGTPPAEQAEPAPAPDSTTGTPTDESKDDADDSNTAPTTDTTDDSSAQPAPAPEPAPEEPATPGRARIYGTEKGRAFPALFLLSQSRRGTRAFGRPVPPFPSG